LLLFVSLESFVADLFAGVIGLESRLGAIIGGIAAALALRPLTTRIEKLMNRYLGPDV
jgi:hypothetical protein